MSTSGPVARRPASLRELGQQFGEVGAPVTLGEAPEHVGPHLSRLVPATGHAQQSAEARGGPQLPRPGALLASGREGLAKELFDRDVIGGRAQ